MTSVAPPPGPAATTIDDVLARMRAIDALLPAADGLACFNRMYLEVTEGVEANLQQGTFANSTWVSRLDVVFANLYFAAVDAMSGAAGGVPCSRCLLVAV